MVQELDQISEKDLDLVFDLSSECATFDSKFLDF